MIIVPALVLHMSKTLVLVFCNILSTSPLPIFLRTTRVYLLQGKGWPFSLYGLSLSNAAFNESNRAL